jgi:histidinol phosphatase-like PHP family hydrolase
MFCDKYSSAPRIDYHVHSCYSQDSSYVIDGSIDAIAKQYKNNGYKAIIITDHSYSKNFSDSAFINEYFLECKKASKGITVIPGIEVDIEEDCSFGMQDSLLDKFSYVVAGIHREHYSNVTNRLMAAICSGKVNTIAHPTNIIEGQRPAAKFNEDLGFSAAARYKVAMEINGARKDLNCKLISKAKKYGCKFVCGSDAHNENGQDSLSDCSDIVEKSKLTTRDFLLI